MTLTTTNSILPPGISQESPTEDSKELQTVFITVNDKVLELLKEEDLDINQLFIMLAMDENKIPLLDKYDNNNEKKKVLILEYQDLQIHGFLAASGPESTVMFDITDKGREFVCLIKGYFDDQEEEKESAAELRKLAADYLEVFPKIKLPSGKYARVASPEIEKKLSTFKKKYKPYFKKSFDTQLTNEEILQATKNYVNRYAKTGYLYMVTSSYFIQKNEKSALADELIAIRQGLTQVKDKFEKQL